MLRYGMRMLLSQLPYAVLFFAFGVTGGWVAVTKDDIGGGWVVIIFMMLTGFAGVFYAISLWRARRWITAFDATGFWWMRGEEVALVRWDSLAGVGIYWAKGSKSIVHTVELCPLEEIDRDDPLLWKFVRDTEPLHPGLPRLRYRVDVGYDHKAYEQALMRWAPDLWFGRKEQPLSYRGQADEKGHRERMAARTNALTPAPAEPVVFDGVDIGTTVVVHRGMLLIRSQLLVAVPAAALCASIAWALLHEPGHGTAAVVRCAVAVLPVLLVGLMVVAVVRSLPANWGRRVTMDATGIHISRRRQSAILPWEALAGVAIYVAPQLNSLELCPRNEIDRDDPLMWQWVREGEPLQPGLPRLRYSISIRPSRARHAVAGGCQQWAPQLWLGGERVSSDYQGAPDSKGHRARTRKARGSADLLKSAHHTGSAELEGSPSPDATPGP